MTKPNRVLATVVNMAVQRGALDLAKLQAQKDDGAFNNTDWNQFVELAGLQAKLRMAEVPKGSEPPPASPEPEDELLTDPSAGEAPTLKETQETFAVSMDTDRIEYLAMLIYTRLKSEGRLLGKGPTMEGARGIISTAIREVVTEDNSLSEKEQSND